MKKLYILIFAANLCFAQSSDLLNTKWEITKIVGETFPVQLPPAMPHQQMTQFSNDPPRLNLSFFNSMIADIDYTGDHTFKVNSKACTLADYMGDNGQVNQFFGRLCNFFDNQSNNTYFYFITNNGNEKILTVSNSTFGEIHFKSAQLSVKDEVANKPRVFPNPASESIVIENLKTNSAIELLDSSGKSIKTISVKYSGEEIDIKNLNPGIYYLKVDGQPLQKIIKK